MLDFAETLELIDKAQKNDEVPIGAVIVRDGKVISKGYNRRETKKNALMHAEIIAIDKACKKRADYRAEGFDGIEYAHECAALLFVLDAESLGDKVFVWMMLCLFFGYFYFVAFVDNLEAQLYIFIVFVHLFTFKLICYNF